MCFSSAQCASHRACCGSGVHTATVVLNESAVRAGQLDVVDALASVPAAKVAMMQAALRKHAHRMQYSAVDTGVLPSGLRGWAAPDAFEVMRKS